MKERSRGKGAQQTRVNRWASGLVDAGGAPGTVRGGGVSESVAKAPRAGIGGEKKRGISTILFRHPGSIRAFATDLDNSTPRAPARTAASAITPASGPARPAPGRRDVHFALERALLTAHLEGEMHLSRAKCTSRRAQDRSAPPPRTASARTAPRRPGPRTTTPGEKAQWDGVSHVVTRPICLDHLRSVGPPGSRNTVVQPHTSGPTALKWSKQKSASTIPPATPRSAPASPPAEQPSGPARAEPASGPNDKGIEGVDIIIAADEGPRRFFRARGVRMGRTDPARLIRLRRGDRSSTPGVHGSSAARMPPTATASDDSHQTRRCPTSRGAPLPP